MEKNKRKQLELISSVLIVIAYWNFGIFSLWHMMVSLTLLMLEVNGNFTIINQQQTRYILAAGDVCILFLVIFFGILHTYGFLFELAIFNNLNKDILTKREEIANLQEKIQQIVRCRSNIVSQEIAD